MASECSNLDGMTPHLRLLSHLAAAAALFAACAGAPANVLDPAFDFGAVLSYAWKEPPRFAAGAADEDGDGALRDLERRVARVLARRGIEQVQKERAQVVLSGALAIDTRERPLDPNYSVYSAEQYEVATLTLQVYDRRRRALVWTDAESLPLRTVGRRFGRRLVEDWTPTGDERRWRVDAMVDALLERLPR